jgi:opacity protein-like surface antigen
MKASRIISAIALALLTCSPALAAHNGPYIGGYGGMNIVPSTRSNDSSGSFNLSYKPAVQWGGMIGWDLGSGNMLGGEGRVEVEYSRHANKLDTAVFSTGKVSAGGTLNVDSLLLSSYYVYRTTSIFSPYLGVGLGAAQVRADKLEVTGQPLSDSTDTVFAYQGGVGVDMNVYKSVSLDLGYRFFGISRPHLSEPNGNRFTIDYYSHSALLGLRVGF